MTDLIHAQSQTTTQWAAVGPAHCTRVQPS